MNPHSPQSFDVSPLDVQSRCARGESVLWLDVRETWEWEVARIDGAVHIPLSTLTREWHRIPRDVPIVVYCHHGVRSLAAAQFLAACGLAPVNHLAGGIDRYAVEIDPRIPRY